MFMHGNGHMLLIAIVNFRREKELLGKFFGRYSEEENLCRWQLV